MPYNNDAINRVSAKAEASPTTTPIAARPNPRSANMRCNAVGDAPSARRMPISRVRCDTTYAITP